MVSANQLILNFFSTSFIMMISFNFFQSIKNATIKDFLNSLNRKNVINLSVFYYLSKMFFSKFFSIWNQILSVYFPALSFPKIFSIFFFSIFGNSFIIQGIKNAIIECFVIVLFCKRQFSLQPTLTFGSFMLFRALHEPWIEKFRTIKRSMEDYTPVGRFFLLLFIGALVHIEIFFSKILLNFHRYRTVNIIIGFELIFLSSSMRGFLIDQIFLITNTLFLNGDWLSEDACALYLRFVVFLTGVITYKHALDCLNVFNKGIFKYYLLRRSFQCAKNYIESLEESTRFRKTTVSVGSLLRNPTSEEIQKLDIQACVICRGEMIPDFSKILSCGHIYHIRCLQNWVRRQYCCPTCLVPISSDSLYSVKKKSDFIKKNFQRKSVNIIAATTGLSKETEIYPRKTKGSYEFSSLPTLNPDITTILFKNQFPEVFQKEKIEDCNKPDFYLKLLEKLEKTRKTILKNFYLTQKNLEECFFSENEKTSGWLCSDSSNVILRIQGKLFKIEN